MLYFLERHVAGGAVQACKYKCQLGLSLVQGGQSCLMVDQPALCSVVVKS